MYCLLKFSPDKNIHGWLMAGTIEDLRRMAASNFQDPDMQAIAQELYRMESPFPMRCGKYQIGGFTLLVS